MKMPSDFTFPPDIDDNDDIEYVDDDELYNLDEDTFDPEENDENLTPEDKSFITFKNHTRSVFCANVDNANQLVVTGGEDDLAYVWNLTTAEAILECTGHKDSVTAVGFSYDSKYVVTGDMSGLIQVWDVITKSLIWCHEVEEMEWLFWHHSAYVLLAGFQSGDIYMWQIPQGNCKVFPTSGSKCTAGVLLLNGTQLAAAYEDGSIKIWDLKSAVVCSQLTTEANLTGLKLSPNGKLLVTCGSSAGALILKTADCNIVATLKVEGCEEIETAAFCPEIDLPIVATGSLNGDVCFWDISRQSLRHKTNIECVVTQITWGPNALLFVCGANGNVYVYNGRNGQLVTTLTGHFGMILDIQVSKDFQHVITTSDDTTAKVFNVQQCCVV